MLGIERLGIRKKLMVITLLSVVGFSIMLLLSLTVLTAVVRYLPNFNAVLELNTQASDAYIGVREYLLYHDTLSRIKVNQALDSGEAIATTLGERTLLDYYANRDSLSTKSLAYFATLRDELNRIMTLEEQVTKRANALMNIIGQRTLLWGDYWNTEKQSMAFFSQARVTLQDYYSSHNLESFGQASRQFDKAYRSVEGKARGFLTSSLRYMARESEEIQQLIDARENALDSSQLAIESFREGIGGGYRYVMVRANRSLHGVTLVIFIGSLLLTALIALIAFFVGKRLSRVYRTIVEALELLRAGDLATVPAFNPQDAKQGDEAGQMIESAVELRARLIELISLVAESARDVQNASQALDKASSLIAEGSRAQEASSKEVETTMQYINARLTDNAQMAKESEGESSAVSTHLAEILAQVTANSEAVQQIAKRVVQVREIASRTNLLALNAAVEAAHAGEQGYGFAVVAQEVRRLAESSATTAQTIITLVEEAVQQSVATQEALEGVQPRVQRSAKLSLVVSETTSQQGASAQHVGGLIARLTQISQQNRESSDLLSQKALQLSQLASDLRTAVDYFQVDIS